MLRGENCKHTTQHLSMECGWAGEWYVGTYVRGTMFSCCIGFIMNCCVFNSVVRCFLFSYCPQLSLPDRICEFILCISKLLLLTLSWMQKISSFEFSRARRKWKFLKFLQQLSVLISKWECETIPTSAFLPSAFLSSSGFLAGNRPHLHRAHCWSESRTLRKSSIEFSFAFDHISHLGKLCEVKMHTHTYAECGHICIIIQKFRIDSTYHE